MKHQRAYIAITSAIIISMVLMAVVFTASITGFRARANVLDSESKAISRFAAEGCIEEAMIKLAEDSSYSGNEQVDINGTQCNIGAVETLAGPPVQKIIYTDSTALGAETSLRAVINMSDFSIASWEEE